MDDEPVISYSVKDILSRVEGKLDAALIAIATKADHSEMVKLAERVAHLELIEEHREAAAKWHTEWKRWLIPTILSALLTASTIFALLH